MQETVAPVSTRLGMLVSLNCRSILPLTMLINKTLCSPSSMCRSGSGGGATSRVAWTSAGLPRTGAALWIVCGSCGVMSMGDAVSSVLGTVLSS